MLTDLELKALDSLIEDTEHAIKSLESEIEEDQLERTKLHLRQQFFDPEDLNSYEQHRFNDLPDIIRKKRNQRDRLKERLKILQRQKSAWIPKP